VSCCIHLDLPPLSLIKSAVSCAVSLFKSVITTLEPSLAKVIAEARPIPEPHRLLEKSFHALGPFYSSLNARDIRTTFYLTIAVPLSTLSTLSF
jgi:hypothetical protein